MPTEQEKLQQAINFVQALIADLKGPDGKAPSREVALAVTKLQEASFWLADAMNKIEKT